MLEIGCASGGNLLPMAATYPESRFVGIDLSPRQIAEAQAGVDALGLRNVMLHAMSLEEIDGTFGTFDYIIAHGVYSWVEEPVREQLMTLCSYLLSPMGVAYISYNVMPGSSMLLELRQMFLHHTRQFKTLPEKVAKAREFCVFLQMALKHRGDAHALQLLEELNQLAMLEDFYLAHEHLEETNEPCYFHQFAAHAQRHRLQFLGEAEIQSMSSATLPAEVQTGLRQLASTILDSEQYGDFLKNRSLRQTLLCHANVPLKRSVTPELVRQFHFACSLTPVANSTPATPSQATQFADADGLTIQIADPLTAAALMELRNAWPSTLSYEEMISRATSRSGVAMDEGKERALGVGLLGCYSSSRALEFHVHPRVIKATVSENPKAAEISRWQAARGARVTNLRHESVVLGPNERALLQKLDGMQNIDRLEATFPKAEETLKQFAAASLLES